MRQGATHPIVLTHLHLYREIMTMNKSYRLALLCALTILGAGQVHAQSQMSGMPQFLPTGGWTVQPTVLSEVRGLQNMQLPCMMATSYDNGYTLRFSGSNNKILAMAIDFRQDVFVQGRKYPASISVDTNYNHNLQGTAFSESVLIFNMREAGGFYNAISDAVKMTVDVQDSPMLFALGGINDALKKLESCSMGGGASTTATPNIQEASLTPDMPAVVDVPNAPNAPNTPRSPEESWSQNVTPLPARVSNEIKKSQATAGLTWEAKAGDDMKATLDGWASRAGVVLDWQATGEAKVVDDVSVVGSFEDAVQTLMARNAAALGLDANMKGAGMQNVSMPVNNGPQNLLPTNNNNGGGGQWSAPVGASMQQILQQWSKQAGVEFIWQSNQGFAVRRPVSAGTYEEALQSLLEQYSDEKIRPNAQLNNDPQTGRRTLFVESSRV